MTDYRVRILVVGRASDRVGARARALVWRRTRGWVENRVEDRVGSRVRDRERPLRPSLLATLMEETEP